PVATARTTEGARSIEGAHVTDSSLSTPPSALILSAPGLDCARLPGTLSLAACSNRPAGHSCAARLLSLPRETRDRSCLRRRWRLPGTPPGTRSPLRRPESAGLLSPPEYALCRSAEHSRCISPSRRGCAR